MSLGETEKVINEQFYATEGGSTVQISLLLATSSVEGINLVVPSQSQQNSQAPITIGYDVVSSGLAPVAEGPLAYTKANEGGDELKAYFYHSKTLARRTAWAQKDPVPSCADINSKELGRTLTQVGFYYAPVRGLPGNSLITMAELDNPDSMEMPGLETSVSDCYVNIFAEVGGVDATGGLY